MNVLLVSLTVYMLSTNATMIGCNTKNQYNIQLMSYNFPLVIASAHPTSPIDYILDLCLSKIKITNIIKTGPLVIPEVDYSNQHGDKQKQWLITDRITKLHILKCHYHVLWKEDTLRCLVNTHREAQEVFGNNGAKSYLQNLRDFYSRNTLFENCVMLKEKLNCLNNDRLIKYLDDNFNDLGNVLDAMNDLYRQSDRFVALMPIKSGIKADNDKIFTCVISFYRHYITLLGFIMDKQDMDASNSSIDINHYMQMVTAEYQNIKIAADNNDIIYFDVKPLKHLSLAYRIFQVIVRLKKQQIVFGLDEINNKYDKRVFDDNKLAIDHINFLNTQFDESANAWHLYALISSNDISMLKESHEFYKAVVDFVRSNKPDTILSTSKKVVDLIYKMTDKTPSHKFFNHLDFDKKAYELFRSIVEFIQ